MTEKYAPKEGDYIKMPGNKRYLPVPNRVQWFRGEHPDWTIHTSVYTLDWTEGYVVMRSEVLDDTGRLIASGMKHETRKGFADFVEKAETGAVGRALARAGYGTEDALDLEGNRFADAPIPQPERGERGSRFGSTAPTHAMTSAPASRTAEEEMLLDMILATGISKKRQTELANMVGIPVGRRATAAELKAILTLIETPQADGSAAAATVPEESPRLLRRRHRGR